MADESEAVVRISKDKETELEFQVKVQGTEDLRAETIVRFVIAKVDDNHDLVFHAKRGLDNSWKVVLPPLAHLDGREYDVRIEVIIDNYYFEPAHGKVMLLSEPRIILTTPHESKKAEKVEERQGGAGVPGDRSAPTAKLLKPEFPPKTSHVQKAPEDEMTDTEELFDIKPGESVQEPQDDGKDEETDETDDASGDFNPQRVAEQIIMDTLGLTKRQRQQVANKPGYLFKRDADGKPVVAALSDPEIKRRLSERQKTTKEEKVKALLRELAK